MYQFIYCFVKDSRINYSIETADSILTSLNEEDREKVKQFIQESQIGELISLNDGNVIFHCLPPLQNKKPAPRPLGEVLDSEGLLNDSDLTIYQYLN